MNRYRYPTYQRPPMDPLYVGSIWKKKPEVKWPGVGWLMQLVKVKEIVSGIENSRPPLIYLEDSKGDFYIGGQVTGIRADEFRDFYEPL